MRQIDYGHEIFLHGKYLIIRALFIIISSKNKCVSRDYSAPLQNGNQYYNMI